MDNFRSIFFCLIMLPTLLAGQSPSVDTFYLYFLGGQSNMEGYGYNLDLPDSLNKTFEDVWIFHGKSMQDELPGGGTGSWQPLKPGHGVGFNADDKVNYYSDRFGAELSFAHRLQELLPGQKLAFIKYARVGTSIDSMAASAFGCWEPDFKGKSGLNQYDHFLSTMRNALTHHDVNMDGKTDILVPKGILWMQGESDSSNGEAPALRYYDNLKRLMDLIRASMFTDDLPVVVGKISDSWNDAVDGKVWDHGELVQYAQEKFARTDANAAIVRSTRYYKYSDPWHYDSEGYIDLGYQFAEAVYKLMTKK